MTLHLPQLAPDPRAPFPPVDMALEEPDGLLAFGGDLAPQRFLNAYAHGIFPWYSDGEPILWWSPSRRAVFGTDRVRVPSRLRRRLRNSGWTVRADTAFAEVVAGCAAPRGAQSGTWITADMQASYNALHALGIAHSIEVFDGETLVGGLFGLSFGQLFCGDSMYSAESGASSARYHLWEQRHETALRLFEEQRGYGALPLLATGLYGKGRTVAWTSDVGPHWLSPDFVAWNGYKTLFEQMLAWATGQD